MKVEHFMAMSLTARSAAAIPAVQGDSVRTVRVHVSVGGAPWAAPEVVSGRVQYTLPDGTPGQYTRTRDGTEAVAVAGDTVTWAIDGVLTEQAGAANVAVVLTAADGGQIGLFPFRVLVTAQPGIGSPESVPSMGKGFEGKLLYGGPDGAVSPLELGPGLEIRDGALEVGTGDGEHNSSGTFVVKVTYAPDYESIDKTNAEIYAAHKDGKNVICTLAMDGIPFVLYPVVIIESVAMFAALMKNESIGVILRDDVLTVTGMKFTTTDDLSTGIEAALEQAKASGDFKGEPGADGKDGVISLSGATVGQTAKITAVDENGVPTAWEPVDFPSGGSEETWKTQEYDFSEEFAASVKLELPIKNIKEAALAYNLWHDGVAVTTTTLFRIYADREAKEGGSGFLVRGRDLYTISRFGYCEWKAITNGYTSHRSGFSGVDTFSHFYEYDAPKNYLYIVPLTDGVLIKGAAKLYYR